VCPYFPIPIIIDSLNISVTNHLFPGGDWRYHFLYVVGEEVPDWEEWSAKHFAK